MTETGTEPMWLTSTLTVLPQDQREEYRRRLGRREAADARAEIAVGYALSTAGFGVEFEPEIGNLTPDARVAAVSPPLVVEVWSRNRAKDIASHDREWQVLRRAVEAIPLGYEVFSHGAVTRDGSAPSSDQTKTIVRELRDFLARRKTGPGAEIVSAGFRFAVAGLASGTRTLLADPWSMGGRVTTDDLLAGICRKVRRYRRLVDEAGVSFMVVVAGEQSSGLDHNIVRDALCGKNGVVVNVNIGSGGMIMDMENWEMKPDELPPVFPNVLSAVGYLDLRGPAPTIHVHPYVAAARPLNDTLLSAPGLTLADPFGRSPDGA